MGNLLQFANPKYASLGMIPLTNHLCRGCRGAVKIVPCIYVIICISTCYIILHRTKLNIIKLFYYISYIILIHVIYTHA